MHFWRLPAQMTEQAQISHPTHTHLSGRWLDLARGAWIMLTLFLLGAAIASQPADFAILHQPCLADDVSCNANGLLTAGQIQSLLRFGLSLDTYAWFWAVSNGVVALLSFVMGSILFWRRSDDWMVLLIALMFGSLGAMDVTSVLGFSSSLWSVLQDSIYLIQGLAILLTLALFPNGWFVPRWTLWIVLVYPAYTVFYLLFLNQLHLPGWTLFNNPVNAVAWFGCWIMLTLAQLHRYFRISTPVERQQTKWVAFTFFMFLVVEIVVFLIKPTLLSLQHNGFLYLLIIDSDPVIRLFIPISIGIAIMRYRLWDIDAIINRTLVYGALTASVAGLYILVVGYLGALFRTGGNLLISLFATGLVAVLFQPLRGWLQRSVNRLTYGQRDEPYAVIARLGRRLESTLAPEAVLPTIVETVAQALKLPYAAITWQQDGTGVIAAAFGKAVGELLRFPLNYQGELIGELVLAPRGPGESFTPADRALLSDLARQAGIATHAVQLTTDLQRLTGELQQSRTQLISAREEERRRLRRDLHDGLGPQLASLTLKLETARNKLAHDPLADHLLADLTSQTQTAVADIRRLVYALRPPALDELGLVSALREQALQYSQQGQSPLLITCKAPEFLPPLPAAVEVAVYRIAQEALTNVVRHARANQCHLHLVLDAVAGVLSLEIQDNGCGLSPAHHRGVGLTSMRERAEELAGTCMIESAATGGTRILVRFPFLPPQTEDSIDHRRLSLTEVEDKS